MSSINDLGFKSKFVLMKVGHDLAESLGETVEAPIPEALETVAAKIPNKEPENSVIPLTNVRYSPHDDEPLV